MSVQGGRGLDNMSVSISTLNRENSLCRSKGKKFALSQVIAPLSF